jgi:PKHD-type hydroxylase
VTIWVRDPARREILYDLDRAVAEAAKGGDAQQIARLARTRSNLVSMWAE